MANVLKNPKYANLENLVETRIKELNPREVKIPILKNIKAFIDEAVNEGREMYIFTDYDVDGITSTAVAVKLFKAAYPKANIIYRNPHRMSEGYGFSVKVLSEVPENCLLITIDNGIVAFDAIAAAKEKGCKVVVIDHHLGKEDGSLPEADYILDPNAIPEQAEFTGYCGCGLTYKLSQLYDISTELSSELRGLAALATIADCVPLREENWVIAKCLENALSNSGINSLAETYQLYGLSEGDAGFKICPTLNAPGRLEDAGAEKASRFLLGETELLEELVTLNESRKEQTAAYMDEAVKIVDSEGLGDDNCICLVMGVPEGLVGILAGRIAEKYQCPAFVFAETETEGVIKGSARTFGSNHLKNNLDKCSDLLLKYGGHAAAAGLSLKEENLIEFQRKMNSLCIREKEDNIYYDAEISPTNVPDEINYSLNVLDEIRPFGEANAEPLFYIPNVHLYPRYGAVYKTMGADNQHIKLFGKDFDIVYFDGAKDYLENPYEKCNIVGKIGVNHFNGKDYYQIEAVYIEKAKSIRNTTALQAALNKRAAERI